MNIQIFGTKKCNDTKKAERFFKERGIKYQFINMKEKGMSKGEFTSVAAGPFQFVMINPVITKKSGVYQTEEGCLSLEGVRPCMRYQEIEVNYLDQNFKKQHGKYSGWTAQIIQHEIDHCNGIVI